MHYPAFRMNVDSWWLFRRIAINKGNTSKANSKSMGKQWRRGATESTLADFDSETV